MSNREFALCVENCVVKLISSESPLSDLDSQHEQHGNRQKKHDDIQFPLKKGMTVEIKDYLTRNNTVSKYCTIKILSYDTKNYAFETNLYMCKNSSLLRVPPRIWPYLIAITDPFERLDFARDKTFTDYISYLSEEDLVLINGDTFKYTPISSSLNFSNNHLDNGKHTDYECVIKFIGLVPEKGNGYYFGLQLVSPDNEISPQANEIHYYANKYLPDVDLRSAFILPANCIKKPPHIRLNSNNSNNNNTSVGNNNSNDKSVTRNLLNGLLCGIGGTLEKANKSLEGLRPKSKQLQQQHSNRNSLVLVPEASDNSTNLNNYKRSLTPDLNQKSFSGKNTADDLNCDTTTTASRMNSSSKFPASISSPNLSKQDSSSSTGSSSRYGLGKDSNEIFNRVFCEDNEDYIRSIESYEERLAKGTQTSSSQSSSASGTMKHSSKNKKKNLTLPAPTVSSSPQIKPATILRYDDRDLVVIDKQDIKESTSNQSDVIIVDPPALLLTPSPSDDDHMDLNELLVGDWPESAGGAASILNNREDRRHNSTGSSGIYRTVERNKSLNPISHFVSTTKPRKDVTFDMYNGNNENYGSKKRNDHFYDNLNSIENDLVGPSPYLEIAGTQLGVGSMVEVSTDNVDNLRGVIRWIGDNTSNNMMNGHSNQNSHDLIVGVELDEEHNDRHLILTDGVYNGQRCFRCPPRRAIFVHPRQCKKDRRFQDADYGGSISRASASTRTSASDSKMFGAVDCPRIEGAIPPLKIINLEDLKQLCGKFKGIQGHHNSCYLDATLFAMFTFTSVFDSLLFRPREPQDIPKYEEVQKVLREEIVNPLRKNLFVRADRVMNLRHLLDKLSSVKGLMTEEKDPEEFLNVLLSQIFKAEPFLKLSSGLDAFYYQLFIEKDERLSLPSVQQLFEQSFLTSDIKLKEVPSCLIIQMPRFGKNFKMYPRILPSQVLDVTDVIEDSPRQCTVCGSLAEYECRECFGMLQVGIGLESTAFCKPCLDKAHSHHKRTNHTPKKLSVPQTFMEMAEHCPVPRLFMELFAVVCIETSHYVAFVKAGSGQDSPWVFFDSMADRKGEQNGYNIPEMVPVPEIPQWLSEEGAKQLHENAANDKMLPEHAKRLLCDAYLCFYYSPDIQMYQ